MVIIGLNDWEWNTNKHKQGRINTMTYLIDNTMIKYRSAKANLVIFIVNPCLVVSAMSLVALVA